jgi:hypothetical protein
MPVDSVAICQDHALSKCHSGIDLMFMSTGIFIPAYNWYLLYLLYDVARIYEWHTAQQSGLTAGAEFRLKITAVDKASRVSVFLQ